MIFTLRNQRDTTRILNLTRTAWYGLLDLADLYGWNPLGVSKSNGWQDLDIPWDGYDNEVTLTGLPENPLGNGRLVILEDALNLADALEQAFYEYEPLKVPASYYLFEPENEYLRNRPSIGAISAVIEFCRLGAFWLETFRRNSSW